MTRIAIDPARPVGRLDRKVFGGFVEHLGRCIYGGLYEEGSPLSDDRGFRKDVLGLLRELRLGVLRWPGGNFVSNYHWADGIGPKDSRPRRPELAWGGEESNRFGTDEYLAYCAELGTEPYICLNMGTGTLADALAWVEYCNSASGTYGFFKEHALKNGDYKDEVKEQPGSASVVQGVTEDRAGIGYSGIGYMTSGVRAVPLS